MSRRATRLYLACLALAAVASPLIALALILKGY